GLWRQKQFRLKRRSIPHCTEESKGRTNMELRENFVLAEGVSQSMSGFANKSPGGSSHSSGSSHSGRSASLTGVPNIKVGVLLRIREKVQYTTSKVKTKISHDGDTPHTMAQTEPEGTSSTKHKVSQQLRGPRNLASPVSYSSIRTSSGSESSPSSRKGSDASDDRMETSSALQTDRHNSGDRTGSTVSFQAHTTQARTSSQSTVTSTKFSRIPKISSAKKK
ncbi:unnamed protein product, partial [Candidula unifasciata]